MKFYSLTLIMFVSKRADHCVPINCLVMSCVTHPPIGSVSSPFCLPVAMVTWQWPFLSALYLELYKPERHDVIGNKVASSVPGLYLDNVG